MSNTDGNTGLSQELDQSWGVCLLWGTKAHSWGSQGNSRNCLVSNYDTFCFGPRMAKGAEQYLAWTQKVGGAFVTAKTQMWNRLIHS